MNEAKCRNCGKLLQTTQYVDGKIVTRLTPDYRETQYVMSDGSKMRVAICQDCLKGEVKDDKIIKTVKKDWDKALELKYGKKEGAKLALSYADVKIVKEVGKVETKPVKPEVKPEEVKPEPLPIQPIKKEKQ
jgi:hypothetical protein